MASHWKKLEDGISAWPWISVHNHRFGGREFRFGKAEVGHVHCGGVVDIPFPRALHDALLARGLAEEHRWVPDSGWITFRVRSQADLERALWLMRLSYLRYALKTAADARAWLAREAVELRLDAQLQSLLEPFVPAPADARAEALTPQEPPALPLPAP